MCPPTMRVRPPNIRRSSARHGRGAAWRRASEPGRQISQRYSHIWDAVPKWYEARLSGQLRELTPSPRLMCCPPESNSWTGMDKRDATWTSAATPLQPAPAQKGHSHGRFQVSRRGTRTPDPIITSVCRARDVVDVAGMDAHKVPGNRPVVVVGVAMLTVARGEADVPGSYRAGDPGRRESAIDRATGRRSGQTGTGDQHEL